MDINFSNLKTIKFKNGKFHSSFNIGKTKCHLKHTDRKNSWEMCARLKNGKWIKVNHLINEMKTEIDGLITINVLKNK